MENQKINELINKAKSSNQQKTIQKIIPVHSKLVDEVQFSFYLEKTLLKKLKQQALNEDTTLKHIINKALEAFLKKTD